MMHIHPEMVHPLNEAGEGKVKKFSIEALNENWAWAERKWSQVTKDTGIGNPHKASKEKGENYFNAVCGKISKLIIDFSRIEENEFYL